MGGDVPGRDTHLAAPSPTLVPISASQALELPASILRPGPGGSGEPGPSYKEAVEGFIQQQRQEGDGDGGTSLPSPGTQVGDRAAPRLPAAARTQELLRLFEAVETPTAREELLQMLR